MFRKYIPQATLAAMVAWAVTRLGVRPLETDANEGKFRIVAP